MNEGMRHDGRMPVLDLSYEPTNRPARGIDAAAFDTVAAAVAAAGWPGVLLPAVCVVGVTVFPVVELTGARERVRTGVGPERSLSTLALWESLNAGAPNRGGVPLAPVRIVGFVSSAPRWDRALASVHAVAGLGAGLVLRSRRPSPLQLLDADADDLWVVSGAHETPEVLVRGRIAAPSSLRRVPATRLIEEGLFAHALACAAIDAAPRP